MLGGTYRCKFLPPRSRELLSRLSHNRSMAQVLAVAREEEAAQARKVWLHAHHDPIANLHAFSPCVRLANLAGDGVHKLLVATAGKKLKVYHGTNLLSENMLLDEPVAIATFYPEEKQKIPSVAVAAGPYVFVYRNLRPYYKFVLPELQIDQAELQAWNEASEANKGQECLINLRKKLTVLRDAGVRLSARSNELLALFDDSAANEFVDSHRGKRLTMTSSITCMETLKREQDEPDSVSMLVLGTEAGQILLLEPNLSEVTHTFQLPSAPVFILPSGLRAVEYRIVCACRDGRIYSVKNGQVTGTVIEMESLPCGLARIDKTIYAACMAPVVHAFHLKGRRLWSIFLPSPALCMEVVEQTRPRSTKAVALGLANGELRMYAEKHLLAILQIGEPITALRFGGYGREDASLVIVASSGSLSIKMLQRKANLESSNVVPGPPPEQDIPLSIPKKTKLYVEHTQREREKATDMHRIFQRDLCKLRLSSARAYVKLIGEGHGPLTFSTRASLRLSAQVQGLGPRYSINISLLNTGREALSDLTVSFHHDTKFFKLESSAKLLPILVPGITLYLDVRADRISDPHIVGADDIRVFISTSKSALPVVSAIVSMPASEMLLGQA